jgi:hypothetical protein
MVVEALIIAICLLEKQADTYRHTKYGRRAVLLIPSFT